MGETLLALSVALLVPVGVTISTSAPAVVVTFRFCVAALMFAVPSEPARAQVTLDVAKITCEQFIGYKVTNPQNIAIWLSGYHNGKRDNTVLDTQGVIANAKKLRDYCFRNPQALVMRAAETLMGAEKKQ